MRNTQLTVLCAVILVAALIVHVGDYMLVQGLKSTGTQVSASGPNPQPTPAGAKQYTIAMMPKATGNAYFINCKIGADEAAKELGVKLLWDGPADNDPAKQSDIVDTWITRGVDAIAVSVDNKGALDGALRRAKAKGIKIVTFDADADSDARDFFVNQATAQGIGQVLMDDAAQTMGGSGDFVIITASLTAANQNEWIKYIKERLASTYPNIHLVEDPLPCDDQQAKATDQAKTVLASLPNVKMIMAICTPGVPGAAEAVKQSGRTDVHVVGLGLPNENKPYVKSGITTDVVLWNTMDLGYLSVYSAYMDAAGTLKSGDKSFQAGKLGTINLDGDNVMLGKPYSFTKDNIDNFNF